MPNLLNAGDLLAGPLDRSPGKTALLFQDTRMTFAELDAGVRRCAAILTGMGVQAGDRVAFLLPDCPAVVQSVLGIMRIGAIAVSVNPALPGADARCILDDSGASVVVTQRDVASLEFRGKVLRCGNLDFDFPQVDPVDTLHPVGPDDIALLLYTSGSTGRPKGVPHRHADLVTLGKPWVPIVLGDVSADTILCVSKFSFSYGLGMQLMIGLAAGATVIQHPGRPAPAAVFALLTRHRPTILFAVPTVYAMLTRSWPGGDVTRSLRLCHSAGENLPPIIYQSWRELTGLEILESLGSTETLSFFVCNRTGCSRPGMAGERIPGYEIRLVGPDGLEVPTGQVGRLLLRGPWLAPFYWNRPEDTAATMLPDGWLDTGDLCAEEQGFYRHMGRANDLMKIAGQWVSPIPIEDCLRLHPAVADCAVAGCHVQGLEYAAAFVVTKPDTVGDVALGTELRRFVRDRLPKHMSPIRIEFLAALPRTATGKVQRHKLRC